MLDAEQQARFDVDGHVTVPGLFSETTMDAALRDLEAWSEAVLAAMPDADRNRLLERATLKGSGPLRFRKLDHPVHHRPVFRQLARDPRLVEIVEAVIGKGVHVFFSQVFLKAPEQGGPKPVHQDDFYFRPDPPGTMLTVWIAMDEATIENGCLYYSDGSHRQPVLQHTAPPDEPYNLQLPEAVAKTFCMSPAPVPRGGVSVHHGHTLHQSGPNRSTRWRRAVAIHYLNNDSRLVDPRFDFDPAWNTTIT